MVHYCIIAGHSTIRPRPHQQRRFLAILHLRRSPRNNNVRSRCHVIFWFRTPILHHPVDTCCTKGGAVWPNKFPADAALNAGSITLVYCTVPTTLRIPCMCVWPYNLLYTYTSIRIDCRKFWSGCARFVFPRRQGLGVRYNYSVLQTRCTANNVECDGGTYQSYFLAGNIFGMLVVRGGVPHSRQMVYRSLACWYRGARAILSMRIYFPSSGVLSSALVARIFPQPLDNRLLSIIYMYDTVLLRSSSVQSVPRNI